MQRDRQLDDAEAAAEMAARGRDGRDDRLADLGGELLELELGQVAEVGRTTQGRKDRHEEAAPVGEVVIWGDGRPSDGFVLTGATRCPRRAPTGTCSSTVARLSFACRGADFGRSGRTLPCGAV